MLLEEIACMFAFLCTLQDEVRRLFCWNKVLACLLLCLRYKMRYVGCNIQYKVLTCLLFGLRYKMW